MGEKSLFYGSGPSRKPDSALSRHPSPGLLPRAPCGSRAYHVRRPGQNLACSHRWFTWPVPRGIPPVGSYPTLSPITCAGRVTPLRPSAGLLSVALDVAAGLRRAAPRVLSPSGLSGPGSSPGSSRVRTLLCAPKTPGHSGGSDGPDPPRIIPYLRQELGSRRCTREREPPRRRRMILVGVRRSSTLSVPLQRFCQRGSSPTAGSNQTPGASETSITPS